MLQTIPAAKQAQVAAHLRKTLTDKLLSRVAPEQQRDLSRLLAKIGEPDFYDVMARIDLPHALDWKEMGHVQRTFAAAEPRFDPKTRAYAESMRLTLHAALLEHFVANDSRGAVSLFERFIALHPTAFHQNGGWVDNLRIPVTGAIAVAEATPHEMWMHAGGLLLGAFITDPKTVAAAQSVRDARNAVLNRW